jgi:diphthine synthase
LPFFSEKWKPLSFYDKIKNNRDKGLHTLVLLDIKVKEPTEESLARGKKVFMEPRFMSTDVCAK